MVCAIIKKIHSFGGTYMNDQMNAPMSPAPSGPTPFYQIWINALTKPNEQTFIEIASSPNAKSTTAFLWVFLASLVQFFFSSFVQGAAIRQVLEQQGRGNLPLSGVGLTILTAVCGAPIVAAIAVAFFAIGVALIQWVAKMFGGRGNFDQLAYTFAAVSAPFTLVATVFVLLGAIPFVGTCFRIIIGVAGLYVLFLEITATKAVNGFGWGQAAGSVLIPGLSLFLVCCCAIFGISMAAGASASKIFQQFQQ